MKQSRSELAWRTSAKAKPQAQAEFSGNTHGGLRRTGMASIRVSWRENTSCAFIISYKKGK